MSARKAIESRITDLLWRHSEGLPQEDLEARATLTGDVQKVRSVIRSLLEEERLIRSSDERILLSERERFMAELRNRVGDDWGQ